MNLKNLDKIQTKLESITRKWWLFLLIIITQFIPLYTSKGVDLTKIGELTSAILGKDGLIYSYPVIYPIFKITPIILIFSIFFFRNRVTRLLSIYAAITYVLFAFLQNIAITNEYGLGIVTSNLVAICIVAAFWFWEALTQKNDFTAQKQPRWKYWVIPFAFLAFWYPANPNTYMPDFNPLYLFSNAAGLFFCMMTPVYLAILTFYYPRVNIATLRVTSFVGLILAFYNILVNFVMFPDQLWWNGILHIPLITISIYAFALSFLKMSRVETK
ncbi:Uncharacterised protein [uncultured archaeon]|nr:Uncharacterised protein [uncultured archaeon]